ncbi:hypothetical protein CRG98_035650 [Punica granatum]|uniref:SUEL-type lectin domain-containing protein n=1 Tax=Punica granatum TaxID=22663 RepID=A0A2I0IJ19_PUNGR|nr:hypothetical protein CRG98_035650 [Punica granatum]
MKPPCRIPLDGEKWPWGSGPVLLVGLFQCALGFLWAVSEFIPPAALTSDVLSLSSVRSVLLPERLKLIRYFSFWGVVPRGSVGEGVSVSGWWVAQTGAGVSVRSAETLGGRRVGFGVEDGCCFSLRWRCCDDEVGVVTGLKERVPDRDSDPIQGQGPKRKKKRARKKSKRPDLDKEEEHSTGGGDEKKAVGSGSSADLGFLDKPELICLYPFTSLGSATQRRIKQQYDELVTSHYSKGLTLAQICIGQNSCTVPVTPEIFGRDPCPSVMKKLSAEVICS